MVAEVGGGDRRAGPHGVLHELVEHAGRAGVYVALQVAADLVVRGAHAADEEQPGGLDRTRGEDDVARPHREAAAAARELRTDDGASLRDQPDGGGAGEQVAAAGRHSADDRRVVGAVLGVGVAREADAGPAADARRPPSVGHRVDQQRHRTGGQTELAGAAREHRLGGVRRQRRHRVATAARAVVGARLVRPADAHLPLDPVVVGLEVLVADRPVGEGLAVGRAHAEVLGAEPPRLRAVHARPAADRERVSVPLRLGRANRGAGDEPRVALRRQIDLALEPGPHAGAARVVEREVGAAQELAALHEQHAVPGLGEHTRRDAAARARPDHDRVVAVREPVVADRRRSDVGALGPLAAGRQRPEPELRPGPLIREIRIGGGEVHGRRSSRIRLVAAVRESRNACPASELERAPMRAGC